MNVKIIMRGAETVLKFIETLQCVQANSFREGSSSIITGRQRDQFRPANVVGHAHLEQTGSSQPVHCSPPSYTESASGSRSERSLPCFCKSSKLIFRAFNEHLRTFDEGLHKKERLTE